MRSRCFFLDDSTSIVKAGKDRPVCRFERSVMVYAHYFRCSCLFSRSQHSAVLLDFYFRLVCPMASENHRCLYLEYRGTRYVTLYQVLSPSAIDWCRTGLVNLTNYNSYLYWDMNSLLKRPIHEPSDHHSRHHESTGRGDIRLCRSAAIACDPLTLS